MDPGKARSRGGCCPSGLCHCPCPSSGGTLAAGGTQGFIKDKRSIPRCRQKWVLGQPGAVVGRQKLGLLAVIPLALLLVLTPELFIFSSALSLTVIIFPSYLPSSYACPYDPMERSCFRPHWRCCSCLLNTFSSPNTSQTPSCSDKDSRLLFARVHLSL